MGVTKYRSVKAIHAIFEVNNVNFSPYMRWRGREGYGSKDKYKVKFTLEQATKAQRETRGISLLFL